MCDLKSKSKLETVKVYKVCYEFEGQYFAVFSGMEVKIGPVEKMKFFGLVDNVRFLNRTEKPTHPLHNELAIGRTTGFKSKRIANRLGFARQFQSKLRAVVLEIELADDIVRGTGEKIMRDEVMSKSIVYAGRTVVSLKEVDSTLSIGEQRQVMENIRIARQISHQNFLKWRERREARRQQHVKGGEKMMEKATTVTLIPV